MLKLTSLKPGIEVIFRGFEDSSLEKSGLIDMGLVPNEKIKVLNIIKKGPVTLLIKKTKLAVGYDIAKKIIIEEI